MNNKVYHLLRNNKEQGVFTAAELIQSGLKPYDLIWVDGRSAAWQYPGEMNEFKAYVLSPDNYVAEKLKNAGDKAEVTPTVQAAAAIINQTQNIQAQEKTVKPRYKVSAAWSKIQTEKQPVLETAVAQTSNRTSKNSTKIVDRKTEAYNNSKALSWEDALQDWKKEKEAPAVASTPVQVQSKVKSEANKAQLETKFAQSIDTITDKYIDNILEQKKKSNTAFSNSRLKEFILPSIALLVILSIGYWLANGPVGVKADISAAPAKNVKPNTTISASPEVSNSLPSTTDANKVEDESKTNDAEPISNTADNSKKIAKYTSAVSTPEARERITKKQVATKTIAAGNTLKTNTKQNVVKPFDASVINNIPDNNNAVNNNTSTNDNGDLNAAESRPVRRRVNDNTTAPNTVSNNTAASSNPPKQYNHFASKSVTNYVTVPQYIEMNNGDGSVNIQNVSDVNLDLVVVDLQYYDTSSRFHKGETLYLHNLKAGKNIVIRTPRDLNSMYATAKVSLVSSDANGVYVVGD